MQSTVEDLQAQVSTLRLMDEELHHLAARNEQLHAESVALQAKLAEAAVALEDRARLQASVEVLRAEEAKVGGHRAGVLQAAVSCVEEAGQGRDGRVATRVGQPLWTHRMSGLHLAVICLQRKSVTWLAACAACSCSQP